MRTSKIWFLERVFLVRCGSAVFLRDFDEESPARYILQTKSVELHMGTFIVGSHLSLLSLILPESTHQEGIF